MSISNDKATRAEIARKHTERMCSLYANEIEYSINNSVIYDTRIVSASLSSALCIENVIDADSISAAFMCYEEGKHMAILNFASYLHPGGGFLRGSKAQEEALCHESTLYNVLKEFQDYYEYNEKHKNKSMYTDRAIFSPDVVFEHDRRMRKISVLTCASPNFSAAGQNFRVTAAANTSVLWQRIRFILDILNAQSVDIAILGAFGCGVFGQNPMEVASIFKEESAQTAWGRPIRLVYAIPQGRRDNNLQEFRKVFGVG